MFISTTHYDDYCIIYWRRNPSYEYISVWLAGWDLFLLTFFVSFFFFAGFSVYDFERPAAEGWPTLHNLQHRI